LHTKEHLLVGQIKVFIEAAEPSPIFVRERSEQSCCKVRLDQASVLACNFILE